jgi:hypothetical protein
MGCTGFFKGLARKQLVQRAVELGGTRICTNVHPAYFHGWQPDAPPRWNEHWGREWELHRSGWDKWDARSAPAPVPLPSYQHQY